MWIKTETTVTFEKCTTSVKIAEAPAPVKPESKWEYPCFARNSKGSIYWIVDRGLEADEVCGMFLPDGDCSRTWTKAMLTPIPKEESAGWLVVIEDGEVRLEKGAGPKEAPKPERPVYPWLGRLDICGTYETLFLAQDVQIKGQAGWGSDQEGQVVSGPPCDETRYTPCAGSVTVTNRPGVEFPRLYRMCGHTGIAMRVAPDAWWDLRDGVLSRLLANDADGGTDDCRLRKEPVDTPLPDGSSVTITFEG